MARGARRVWAAGFFAVAALVATYPLILHIFDTVPVDLGDPLLNAWILACDAHALTTDPLHLFDANIFYPFPQPLTYSDALLSGALLVAPVTLVTHNAVLAYNVLLLTCLWLAGFGMCLLVRDVTQHEMAAVVAGCLFYGVNYAFDDPNFYLNAHFSLVLGAGFGALAALRAASDRARGVTAVACGALFLFPLLFNYPVLDKSRGEIT